MAYACLVAILCQDPGYHLVSEKRLTNTVAGNNAPTPLVGSAGALVEGMRELGFKKVAIITPYMKSLTQQVIDYIEDTGIQVSEAISLEVSDNLAVGRLNPLNLIEHADRLDISNVGCNSVVGLRTNIFSSGHSEGEESFG